MRQKCAVVSSSQMRRHENKNSEFAFGTCLDRIRSCDRIKGQQNRPHRDTKTPSPDVPAFLLDQALNAKELAVLAGISYSTARELFRLRGFPILRGVVFWGDFVDWDAVKCD